MRFDKSITICGTSANSADTVQGVAETKPDVILIESQLMKGAHTDMFERLIEAHPRAKIMLLTQDDNEDSFAHSRANVHGYIQAGCTGGQIASAIRWVVQGATWVEILNTASSDLDESKETDQGTRLDSAMHYPAHGST